MPHDEGELAQEIRRLAKQKNAVILAHNYQRPEVQDLADITGDSLGLSMDAAATDADLIVFCGVLFMAESASILSPEKKVVLPRLEAGCPMADMITAQALENKRRELGEVRVVTYVNSPAEAKAVSDICCTSANAVSVVRSLPESDRILFTPDRNLADYAARMTGREILRWNGYCPTHDLLTSEDVLAAKREHPDAAVMAHPECRREVLELADAVRSTSGMLAYARQSDAREFIVGTELGLIHKLRQENPGKAFVPASLNMICPTMKFIGLRDIKRALLEPDGFEVRVPERIRVPAKRALDRMLAVPRD